MNSTFLRQRQDHRQTKRFSQSELFIYIHLLPESILHHNAGGMVYFHPKCYLSHRLLDTVGDFFVAHCKIGGVIPDGHSVLVTHFLASFRQRWRFICCWVGGLMFRFNRPVPSLVSKCRSKVGINQLTFFIVAHTEDISSRKPQTKWFCALSFTFLELSHWR